MKINIISDSTYTVQGHGVHTAFMAQALGLKRLPYTDVDVNSWSRGYDITHIHTFGALGFYHAVFGSGKKVISAHVIPESLVGSIIGAKYWMPIMKAYMKFFYNRADLVLAVSPMVVDSLKNDVGIRRPMKVLYNGMDMRRFKTTLKQHQEAREQIGIEANKAVIVSNGQIQPRKRFDLFCEAAKSMPRAQFIWIGGSPFKHLSDDYGKLKKLTDNAPENVLVTGVIPHEQVDKYLSAADIFWLPSMQENHPMAVLEAAGAGLPIVLRDINEYKDSFKEDPIYGNDSSFAKIINKLINDPEYLKSAKAGTKKIAERFDISSVARQLRSDYESILD